MSKWSKHIGVGEPLKIGDDELMIPPLDTSHIDDFFMAMKSFSGAKEGASIGETLANVDNKGTDAIKRMIDTTLDKAMPDETEEVRRQFGLKYMSILLPKIFEINSAQTSDGRTKAKIEAIQRMRQKKNEPASTD